LDPHTSIQQLFNLTGSLQPSGSANAGALRVARVAIAQSLLSHEPQIASAATLGGAQPIDAELQKELESVVAEASAIQAEHPGLRIMVRLRQFPDVSSLHPCSVSQAVAGMEVAQSFGPFLGTRELQYWIDLYPIVVQPTITRWPATAPFLSMPLELLLHPLGHTALALGAGSVWFQSPLLAASAPAGSWTGLKIRGGSIVFGEAPTFAAGSIEISASTTVTIKLQLDSVDTKAGLAQLPSDVTIVFGPSSATITAASNATLTVNGTTIELDWNGARPQYQASLQKIVVPFAPRVAVYAHHPAVSDLFSRSGSATVGVAGWGLPVTITTSASLGRAAGAGTLDLEGNAGLAGQRRGANNHDLVGAGAQPGKTRPQSPS
jgi:hypothetical protein